ncbi:B-cell receptor CD22-like [Rhinatrema bivittatum]|uniref:B-cell receptor CD22-like n=1 Tax=Rhinatrema bivittatum TaxID=194408 RepID=UPI00112D4A4A|nr:B-cell receptor CD22-like [Rhinatrema bivittatum]
MIFLPLLLFPKGFSCSLAPLWEVKFVNISAWTGSCAFFDCTYKWKTNSAEKELQNVSWIRDPVYEEKDWKGTVVYHSVPSVTVSSNYTDRVSFLGDMKSNCGLIIKDLRKEDEGCYGIRLMSKSGKWMSMPFLSLNITDSPPDPKIIAAKGIKELEKTTITCSVDYYCPDYSISLSWEGPVNGIDSLRVQRDNNGIRTENTLTFTPSWMDHNKTLTCRFSDKQNKRSKSEILLNVIYAPKIVQIYIGNERVLARSTKTVKEGDAIILRCAEGSSNPAVSRYSWHKNKKLFQSDPLLEIHSAAVEHAGEYTCQATNDVGYNISEPLKINVQHTPRETKITMSKTPVKESDDLTLTCESLSNPPVTSYSWYKDRVLVPDHTVKEIHLNELHDSDSGSYRCEVSNALGNGSSPAVRVDVMYAPRSVEIVLNSPGKQIKRGEMVTLTCTYNSSNPAVSEYHWISKKKTDFKKLQSNGNELQFRTITEQDSGQYGCQAINDAGQAASAFVTINVLYAPKEVEIEVLHRGLIREGNSIKLRCSAKASNPKATEYTWYKDGRSYTRSHDPELAFETIQSTDAGDYECEAGNQIGRVRSKGVSLDVQYAPRNVKVLVVPAPELIVEYSDVVLVCENDANPTVSEYRWYREAVMVKEHRKQLSLRKMSQDQVGEYQCEVNNGVGASSSKATIVSFSYSSTSIIKFVALGIGLLICLVFLLLLILRFMLWKKQQRMPTIIQNPEDERNDSFFVMTKKHSRDETADERVRQNRASVHCASEDRVTYASLQFSPSYTEAASEISRMSAKNRRSISLQAQDAGAIYSTVQRPGRSLQGKPNADYENFGEMSTTRSNGEKEEDIHYASIINLKQRDWKSSSDSNDTMVQYAALRH